MREENTKAAASARRRRGGRWIICGIKAND
jgi:hypothetical protein